MTGGKTHISSSPYLYRILTYLSKMYLYSKWLLGGCPPGKKVHTDFQTYNMICIPLGVLWKLSLYPIVTRKSQNYWRPILQIQYNKALDQALQTTSCHPAMVPDLKQRPSVHLQPFRQVLGSTTTPSLSHSWLIIVRQGTPYMTYRIKIPAPRPAIGILNLTGTPLLSLEFVKWT